MNWTGFEEDWKHVLENRPVEALKVFALAVQKGTPSKLVEILGA
jgi:hypothetical protein